MMICVTKEQTRERLLWLREDMLKAPPRHVNMRYWWKSVSSEPEFVSDRIDSASRGEWPCGTSACAAGIAAMDPRFKALGLKMAPSMSRHGPNADAISGAVYLEDGHYRPAGAQAMAAILGITLSDAATIFVEWRNCQGQEAVEEVVAKIDHLLKHGFLRERSETS